MKITIDYLGKHFGYKKGFLGKAPNLEIDYLESRNLVAGNNSEEKFNLEYTNHYRKGQLKRENLIYNLQNQFGEISKDMSLILDDFLAFIFKRFWGSSFLFSSWDERLNKELEIVSSDFIGFELNKIEDLTKNSLIQKAIENLKIFAFLRSEYECYFQVLLYDLTLKVARLNRREGLISSEQLSQEINGLMNRVDYQIQKLKQKNRNI